MARRGGIARWPAMILTSTDARAGYASRWPLYLSAAGAVALAAAASSTHLPKVLALCLGASLPAFLLLLRLGRDRGLAVCVVIASFFSAAPAKVGQLDMSDVF